jgi:hypothetical protein
LVYAGIDKWCAKLSAFVAQSRIVFLWRWYLSVLHFNDEFVVGMTDLLDDLRSFAPASCYEKYMFCIVSNEIKSQASGGCFEYIIPQAFKMSGCQMSYCPDLPVPFIAPHFRF